MANAVMLLSNPFRPDPRVLKEAQSLVERGHRITVIAWDRQSNFPANERLSPYLRIIRVQKSPSQYGIGLKQIGPLYRFWLSAWKIMNDLQPNLIHCHDFDTLPVGLFWSKCNHTPIIYDAHEYYAELVRPRLSTVLGKFVYMAIRNIERVSARRVDAIITVDQRLAESYQKLNPTVLIIGHYPSASFVDQPAPVFTHSKLTLLYLGRFSQDRGLIMYLDLLRSLLSAGIPAELHMAGVFTPSSEEKNFLAAAKDLNEHIKLSGWLAYKDVPDALSHADVGLSLLQPEPRYITALPVKLFEYMAAGLPVLASDFPSIRQVVAEEDCGALLDPSNPQSAADLLTNWWRQPEIPRRLGFNGRKAVLARYNWESLAKTVDVLYQNLT